MSLMILFLLGGGVKNIYKNEGKGVYFVIYQGLGRFSGSQGMHPMAQQQTHTCTLQLID